MPAVNVVASLLLQQTVGHASPRHRAHELLQRANSAWLIHIGDVQAGFPNLHLYVGEQGQGLKATTYLTQHESTVITILEAAIVCAARSRASSAANVQHRSDRIHLLRMLWKLSILACRRLAL